MTGSEFAKILVAGNLFGIERELAILRARSSIAPIGGGGVWSDIVSTATVAGKARRLVMQCSPLPFAIGTNSDPFLTPAYPWTYQALANDLDAVIPSRKMCMLVAKQAAVRIEPRPMPLTDDKGTPDGGKTNELSSRYAKSDTLILKDLQSAPGYSPGKLVSGAKKDVVVGPGLNGSQVAIFGWFHKDGKGDDNKVDRWQPYSTIHPGDYVDYSHGWRVFRRKAKLDGVEIDIDDVATDKLLHVLISDQGPFSLRFPNAEPEVAPPAGYPPGTFAKGGGGGTGTGGTKAKKTAVLGGAVLGGAVGFAVGGPVGAAVGAVLGGALGRA